MIQTVRPRSEIAKEHTWDVESVFPSIEAFEAEMAAVREALVELTSFKGRLGDGPTVLADWLEASNRLFNRVGKLYTYSNLHYTVNTADQQAAALNDRTRALYAHVNGTLAFEKPEIIAIGFETLRAWTEEEPRLAIYRQYFDELERLQAHIREPEVEELLGLLADPFRSATSTHGLLTDADLLFEPAQTSEGEEVPIAQGNLNALLTHSDREVRRTAWENYADAHLAYKNTMANVIATGVKQHAFTARARRYGSSLESALGPNHIPTEVFHNLIETFRRHLPTWHRYWAIRRQALGYERLYPYDVKAPLTAAAPEVPYEQAVEWICAGMAPLGEEYVSVMRRGCLEERWVDIYPNQGKRAGAFSSGTKGTHPFILMSYTDDLFSLSTLAHELGHSMHSYFARQSQPYVYSGYSIFVAEVASNFNQALVRAHLLEQHSDPAFQIALIEEAMSNFHRYFFIMPTLARFELEIHERVERGEGLTADSMIALMADLFQEGFGDEVAVDRERVGITWAQFPTHMYLNFYVFQYATGISGAHALAEKVLAGEAGAVERYLDFLRAGSSLYPLQALQQAGVDLTSPEPVEQTFGVLAHMVDRLAELTQG